MRKRRPGNRGKGGGGLIFGAHTRKETLKWVVKAYLFKNEPLNYLKSKYLYFFIEL